VTITAEQRQELIRRAIAARRHAYAPYSQYAVGAALLAESGKIYDGVNVENAVYPAGTCAERTAVFSAVAHGERSFRAMAVVSRDGGTPCGSCRQVLSEFGLDVLVLIADQDGHVVLETTVADLLPHAFGPGNLQR
jgi:cytidine deaminase